MLATSKVPKRILPKLEKEIKMMLHAHRDCLRIRHRANLPEAYDPKVTSYVANDGYYGEAFGILRAMQCAGWGRSSGPVNIDSVGNLRYWFDKLCTQVLEEENFPGLPGRWKHEPMPKGDGSGRCEWCYDRYGRDDSDRPQGYEYSKSARERAAQKRLGSDDLENMA